MGLFSDMMQEVGDLQAQNVRMKAALEWALGSGPAPDGSHFGDKKPEDITGRPYWWRKELREMAGL